MRKLTDVLFLKGNKEVKSISLVYVLIANYVGRDGDLLV